MSYFIPKHQIKDWIDQDTWLYTQCWDRLKRGITDGKRDLMYFVMREGDDKAESTRGKDKETWVTDEEIHSDAGLFLTAGTDTSSHTLGTLIFHLLQHPQHMKAVKNEVRNRFSQYEDITAESIGNMPYITAVIWETLRLKTPTAVGFGRRVGKVGEMISGHFIPSGTGVQVAQFPNNRSSRNFHLPDEFRPERWLGDERFASDKKDSFQPFSIGARNCLGKVRYNFYIHFILTCETNMLYM